MPACALCGAAAPAPFRAPPPEGSPDLDGRPGEPTRSTLPRWLQRCRQCGACAPDLAALPPSAAARLHAAGYAALSPPLRWAALAEGTADAAAALLQAAWATEDHGEDATALRIRAAAAWPDRKGVESLLRLADVQRRANLLADAALTLDRLPQALDDPASRIVAFERARIAAADTGRHLVSSALRPPATRPHAAHSAHKARETNGAGFWSRLLGGAKR